MISQKNLITAIIEKNNQQIQIILNALVLYVLVGVVKKKKGKNVSNNLNIML